MSSLLGNICLFLAAVVSGTLISSVNNYKAPLGGSGGAEAFPIWMLLLHFALLCTLGLAAFIIASNGGFDWIPLNKYARYLLITICLILTVITSLMSALMLKQSDSVPALLGCFLQYGYIAVPVVLVAAGFILNNSFLREIVPVALYKWPLVAVLGLSISMIGAGIYERMTQGSAKERDQKYENGAEIKSRRLEEIETADITRDIVRILEFTRSIYPAEVRQKAIAKIKSHPDWQKELIQLLEDDRARYAIHFFASNPINDKKFFVEPLEQGLLMIAANIRHDIQGTSPSAFSKDMFSEEVDCALKIVDIYEGMGVDYLPAIRAIRAALDEPVAGKIMRFQCREVLDDWLKKYPLNVRNE
jgi:hypothetical protein